MNGGVGLSAVGREGWVRRIRSGRRWVTFWWSRWEGWLSRMVKRRPFMLKIMVAM